ncbi:MAG: HlyD family efflux transporter periplasmic adaptor subunit [Candidatus Margulisiibacteriota bacterium]
MQKNKGKKLLIILICLAIAGGAYYYFYGGSKKPVVVAPEIKPEMGKIELSIMTSGTVQPRKRIEITPPISGRVEQILVSEGSIVRKGQVLAWLSSNERAALLDAAYSKGSESIKYWEEAYKPIPLIAPIDGEVIVRGVEPGQSVNSSTPVLVLADRLIVKAVVDETDISRVKEGQTAELSLDAYPKIKVAASVAHIAYEAKVVSNVTMYEVEILPANVPKEFRSGMSASVKIIEAVRDNVLTLTQRAVITKEDKSFVLVKTIGESEAVRPERRRVVTGLADDQNIEIKSGLSTEDTVIIRMNNGNGSNGASTGRVTGTNPFMPFGRGAARRR